MNKKKNLSNNNTIGISEEFKDLFEKMIYPKPEERISISQIKSHPWLQDLTNFYCEGINESKLELNKKNGNINEKKKTSPPKKNKIKYLLHKSSFNKEEKKFEKKNENNYDNISNHSDDTNQKLSNNSNLVNFQNFLEDNTKNMKKNFFKDIEIKCLKEFTSRKYNIDKILKEQEDDGD